MRLRLALLTTRRLIQNQYLSQDNLEIVGFSVQALKQILAGSLAAKGLPSAFSLVPEQSQLSAFVLSSVGEKLLDLQNTILMRVSAHQLTA